MIEEIHHHVDMQLTMFKENTEARFKSSDEAIGIATMNIDRRLAEMNEFRGQLKDQASTFITRQEYYSAHEAFRETMRKLENWQASIQGMATQKSVTGSYFLGMLAICIAILDIVLRYAK